MTVERVCWGKYQAGWSLQMLRSYLPRQADEKTCFHAQGRFLPSLRRPDRSQVCLDRADSRVDHLDWVSE